jgi:Domain of unknown function (DUF2760)
MAAMSFGRRVVFAFRSFFALLFKGTVPADIVEVVAPSASLGGAAAAVATAGPLASAAADDPGDRAIQLLALLQRDGRLVDFLFEDIAAYSDAQVGVAVREVHTSCRRVIDRYLPIEPILADLEGQTTALGAPVDPSTVKLVGNVGQQASYRGTVRHRGWRVGRSALPPLTASAARQVVTPAEVEII